MVKTREKGCGCTEEFYDTGKPKRFHPCKEHREEHPKTWKKDSQKQLQEKKE